MLQEHHLEFAFKTFRNHSPVKMEAIHYLERGEAGKKIL